jgi:bifunctional isochorismate lyase/aryl carrier protein
LVHDLQDYFVDFYGEGARVISQMLDHVAQLRKLCAEVGIPVAFTAQPGTQDRQQRGLLQDMWGPGITAHPGRTNVARAVAPSDGDTVFTKWRYSAFAKTNFLDWMRAGGRDQLIISGVYAHIGCQVTATEAFMSDLQPFFVADAMADFTREHHLGALNYVADCCGVATTTRAVLAALSPVPAQQASPGTQPVHQVLRQEVLRLLDVSDHELQDDDDLFELGLDSVRLMDVVERLQDAGVDVDFTHLAEAPSLSRWYQLVGTGPRT